MTMQLRRLFERPDEKTEISEEISLEELGDLGTSVECVTPIKLRGRIENQAGMVTLSYTLQAEVKHLCDRCLKEFSKEYELSLEHILVRSEEEALGDDDIVCEGLTLDLSETAVSDLLINLPTKVLCRDDCLGLCPECGANLNDGDCGCPGAVHEA